MKEQIPEKVWLEAAAPNYAKGLCKSISSSESGPSEAEGGMGLWSL